MPLALIVDDSKTSRYMLRKMLEKHQVAVQMVESAEEALAFLQSHRPDLIFMDHMMPGMDGFAAVKAIKADPQIASIPIIMHTTKQGDIYMGQAKALGAVDILSKPASDQALIEVLARVEHQHVESVATASRRNHSEKPKAVDLNLNLDVASAEDLSLAADNTSALASEEVAPSFWGTRRQLLVTLVWLLPVIWLLALYGADQAQLKQLKQQQLRWADALQWVVNREQFYDYGELPLDGDRLELLAGLLKQLQLAGFKGVVRLEGHIGEFCLTQIRLEDGSAALILPRPDLPLDDCDVLGTSTATAMARSIEKSPAFELFMLEQANLYSNIKVEVAAYGATVPRYAYPRSLSQVTAGDWNEVALNNNRLVFTLLSSSP